jgi:hypothetical protein
VALVLALALALAGARNRLSSKTLGPKFEQVQRETRVWGVENGDCRTRGVARVCKLSLGLSVWSSRLEQDKDRLVRRPIPKWRPSSSIPSLVHQRAAVATVTTVATMVVLVVLLVVLYKFQSWMNAS